MKVGMDATGDNWRDADKNGDIRGDHETGMCCDRAVRLYNFPARLGPEYSL